MKMLLLVALFFYAFVSFAQSFSVNGIILDSVTREPLPFVNIVVNNGTTGGISDLDGKFCINSTEKPLKLSLSFVGYEQLIFDLCETKNLTILLVRTSYQLNEVIILPGENPAHRIINNAVTNREFNNPLLLNSFSYKSYNRFYVSPDMELLRAKVSEDSDTSYIAFQSFFEERFLFLMESISVRKFLSPDISEERILASRVAGFSDPVFTLLMTQIQSFAFYDDLISISDKNYVNPVSKGSTQNYFFLLEDTLYDGQDSVFVVSFRPGKGKNFDALQGLLYIHSDGWAIQNVIAAPSRSEKGFSIRIQQQYERTGADSVWFPVQLNTEILFNNVSLNELDLFGNGRTYLYDISINNEIRKRDFSNAQIVFDDSSPESLDELKFYNEKYGSGKDLTTYSYLDSLSKENKLDRLLNVLKVAANGKIPFYFIDIPLFSIVNFNDFEGWRLGLGLETNRKLIENFSIGGYVAYGFIDQKIKYGTHVQYHNSSWNDLIIRISNENDVSESGGMNSFDYQQNLLDASSYRTFLFNVMDYYSEYKFEISGQIMRHTQGYISYGKKHIQAGDNYLYGTAANDVFSGTPFFFADVISVGLDVNPNIQLIQGLDYQIGLIGKSSKPVLKLQWQSGVGNHGIQFHAIDLSVGKKFYTKYFGTSEILVETGLIDRPVPYPFMRVIPAAYRSYNFYIPNSFLTVRMNEFVSDRYVYFFGKHNFGKLLLRNYRFSPGISLAINGAWGNVREKEKHRNRQIISLEKGIFEAGCIIDHLLSINAFSFGFASFYRFGAYSFSEAKDNVSVMISVSTAF